MFGEIFRFELRQQLRSPLFWLIAAGLAAIAFGAAASDSIQIGGGIGSVHRNAPYVVITMLAMFSVLGLMLIPIFVAGAALRDFNADTAELMFATPVPRGAYLGGRFAAGWLVSVLTLVAVAIGMWLGSLMPWLDATRLGPTPWTAYGWALGVLVLPNLFFLGALLFLLAVLTRSMVGTYVGVIAFLVLTVVAGQLLGHGNIEHQTAGALINPFGGGALDLATRYWTTADKNTRIPWLTGLLLGNRGLWVAIGVALLAVAMALFRPDREGLRWFRRRKRSALPDPATGVAAGAPVVLPLVRLREGFGARWIQFRRLAWFETKSVLGGAAFIVIVLIGLGNLTASLSFIGEIYGTPVYPVTHLMAGAMDGSYKWLLLIVLVFYAGELVWRERGARIDEVVDAFPTPDWIPLLAKVTALAMVIVAFLAIGSVYAMGYQLLHGFHYLQPLLYLELLGLSLLGWLLMAILAVVFQVWSNNKYAGWALIIAWLIAMFGLGQMHFTDNLYLYGNAPGTPYSDMNGFGSFWIGNLWFRAYWYCCAIALLVVAGLYWVRGNTRGWRARGRVALQRFGWAPRIALAAALAGFVVIGAFDFHNTHRLYRYETHDQRLQAQANYEKDYRKYLGMAQPRITGVNVDIAIHPDSRTIDVTGHYTLVNRHDQPIDTLLVQLPTPDTRDFSMDLDFAPHTVELADKRQGFYLYKLATPLAPGASMPFGFREHAAYPGFANEPAGERLIHNGTFLSSDGFPRFCYATDREIKDPNDRRKHGLGPSHLLPDRGDTKARGDNLLSCDSDWVHFEATLSTSLDQVAIAPGYLQKEWVQDGRRYFHYVQDTPILDFFSFQSARFDVARSKWHDVNLEVYYDRRNAWNARHILDAMRDSLAYYTKHFGPYQFRQLRILEIPNYFGFAQSFANTVPFTEDFVLQDLRKPSDIDYLTYVTAHETAHQWWGHQAIGGMVRGVTMLDESLAQYSALMVMKHLYGPTRMRKFLKYELDSYLSGRATAKLPEQPLSLVQPDQGYIHYRKGSVIFYALQDYLGEDKVDAALRTWLDKVKFQQPPYTDTRELIADLRAQAGPQYQNLITDFFDKITLFDDRMVKATAKKLPNGKYQVTMHVHAAKYYADGEGKQTRAKLDIPIEIGVFAQAKDGEEQDEQPLYLAKYPVADGDSVITLIVDGKPYEAGIDPFNELVDRVSNDNRAPVTIE